VGAAAGFVEPLESTELHLTQSMIARLLSLFPERESHVERAEYNRLAGNDLERARDLAVLHYATAQRPRSEFWRRRAAATLPDTLVHKMSQYCSRGKIVSYDEEPLPEAAWVAVFMGQGVWPRRCEALAEAADPAMIRAQFTRIREAIAQSACAMPTHAAFIGKHGLGAAGSG
jgi:tryptophan halogenase